MLGKYNKIILASKMFEEAHKKFVDSKNEMDLVSSILLSGAVVGIVAPLLKEQEGLPIHDILAKIGNLISVDGDKKQHKGLFRETYNSLKHTGNYRKNIKASEDIEFETDLNLEASRMLFVAKSDFKEIITSYNLKKNLPDNFINLIESKNEYE